MSGDFATFGGTLTADVLKFNPENIPKPDTLFIRMTRGEHRIADEVRSAFGGFKRVVIDVDGERHEFDADAFVGLLESYERGTGSNWDRLFSTPEKVANTLVECCDRNEDCSGCPLDRYDDSWVCKLGNYDAILQWIEREAE